MEARFVTENRESGSFRQHKMYGKHGPTNQKIFVRQIAFLVIIESFVKLLYGEVED